MTQTNITEETLKNIEIRLNDIIRFENSVRQLNVMMVHAATQVDIHVGLTLRYVS